MASRVFRRAQRTSGALQGVSKDTGDLRSVSGRTQRVSEGEGCTGNLCDVSGSERVLKRYLDVSGVFQGFFGGLQRRSIRFQGVSEGPNGYQEVSGDLRGVLGGQSGFRRATG